jgi:hypothetical protein
MQEQMDMDLLLIKYAFLVELRQNLATNKADYGKMIRETTFSPKQKLF